MKSKKNKKVKFTPKTKKNDGCSILYQIIETLIFDHLEEKDLHTEFIDEIIEKIIKKNNCKENIKNIKINIKKQINNLIKKISLFKRSYIPVLNHCEGNKKYCINMDNRFHISY